MEHQGKNKKHLPLGFPVIIATFLKQHWVLYTLLNLSAVAIPFVYTYFGVQLHFVKLIGQETRLSLLGIVVLIVYSIIYVLGNGAIIYDQINDLTTANLRQQLIEQKDASAVLSTLKRNTNKVCDSKLTTLIEMINSFRSNTDIIPPRIMSDPTRQLGVLVNEFSDCIASLLKFDDPTGIFTSIIYRFPQEDNIWKWGTRERGLSIAALTNNVEAGKKSTFQTLIEHKGHYLFKNSKQAAYERGMYIPDDEDEYDDNEKLKGSIACFQHQIMKNNKVIIEFVITVCSYSRQFLPGENVTDGDITTARENIDKVIVSDFALRTKIELCLLYLDYLYKVRSNKLGRLSSTDTDLN